MHAPIEYDPPYVVRALRNMDAHKRPEWGVMTPQHMVEHLIIIFKISNGGIPASLRIEEEKLPRQKAFLNSEEPFPKNFPIEGVPKDEPLPLHFDGMEAAVDKLEQEMARFEAIFQEDPDRTILHPMFGALTYEEWVRFHRKHITHHFDQFGLLPGSD